MITLSTLIEDYLDHTKDDSATNTERGIKKINRLHKLLCASDAYWWLEKDWTQATVAGVNVYPLPVDYRKMRTVRQSYGSYYNVLEEIVDTVRFNNLVYTTSASSSYPLYYHLEGNNIIYYPTPSSVQTTVYSYVARPVDMTTLDYNEGGILTLANGNTAVTGTGTYWLANAKAGNYLIINDLAYQIASVISNTSLTLAITYQGTSISTSTPYTIADIPLIPQDFADILWVAAARDYFLKKEDRTTLDMYSERFYELENRLKTNTRAQSSENVIQKPRLYPKNPNLYPTLYP